MFFKKFLIRLGKFTPFLFAAVLLVGHCETIRSVAMNVQIETEEGVMLYALPASEAIGQWLYIDPYDVLLVYILCFALELCNKAFFCAHYVTLGLCVRWLYESVSLEEWSIISISAIMAVIGAICVYFGIIKLLFNK